VQVVPVAEVVPEVLEGRHDEDQHRGHGGDDHGEHDHRVSHGRADLAPQGHLLLEGPGHLDQDLVEEPPISPARTMETYRRLKTLGCLAMAADSEVPFSTSARTWTMTSRRRRGP
jgi:hypothetical protein